MAGDSSRLLLVRLSGTRMAMNLAEVTEVTELPETWQIPLVPSVFKGVMNSHGRPIPVLDLASWTGSGIGSPTGKTLILDRRIADLALWVDDVERVVQLSEGAGSACEEGYISAVVDIEGCGIPLISAESLVEMLEQGLQSAEQSAFPWSKGTA